MTLQRCLRSSPRRTLRGIRQSWRERSLRAPWEAMHQRLQATREAGESYLSPSPGTSPATTAERCWMPQGTARTRTDTTPPIPCSAPTAPGPLSPGITCEATCRWTRAGGRSRRIPRRTTYLTTITRLRQRRSMIPRSSMTASPRTRRTPGG